MSKADLSAFRDIHVQRSKGSLAIVLHLTRLARDEPLPASADHWKAESGGQVLGAGKSRVQSILADYGIERTLAEEAGRTSRGSIKLMVAYFGLLTRLQLDAGGMQEAEKFWVNEIREYFKSKPYRLVLDASKSVLAAFAALFAEVEKSQAQVQGATYLGTVLQHLIGAKLDVVLGEGILSHHGASVADDPSGRSGDFLISGTAIHVTTAPGEALVRKTASNLEKGLSPIIITLKSKEVVALELVRQRGLTDRVEVIAIEAFLVANVHERSGFQRGEIHATVRSIVARYNEIVDQVETDPGLRIELVE